MTAARGELAVRRSTLVLDVSAERELDERERDWLVGKGFVAATEFVSAAVVLGEPGRAREAALELSRRTGPNAHLVRSLAARSLSPPAERQSRLPLLPSDQEIDSRRLRERVQQLRGRLAVQPRDATTWIELALAYATLGQIEPAQRAVQVGLALAPENRYVLRSAAAFYAHIGEAARAHAVLMATPRVREDPWLSSAEIATANLASVQPRTVRSARQILEDQNFSDFEVSELAAALGTTELHGGVDRRARKLFRRALILPTENSLAQVEWASRPASLELPGTVLDRTLDAYEAQARRLVRAGDWMGAVSNSRSWLLDQPFAVEPAITGSFAAATGLRDFELGFEIASASLEINPTHPGLANNVVYALIELGRLQEAAAHAAALRLPASNDPVRIAVLATQGMLAYRTGFDSVGRSLYERAVSEARRLGEPEAMALALLMFAREESIAGALGARDRVTRALEAAAGINEPAVRAWAKTLADQQGDVSQVD